ncbi:MAG: hypothetical protein ACRD3M_19225 [Thermoanaerobaculia bacterium]
MILIAGRLSATAKGIRQIRDALARVEADTRPLGETLEKVNGALAQLSGGLASIYARLIRADVALASIAKRFRSSAA